jgi:hypothetical protein
MRRWLSLLLLLVLPFQFSLAAAAAYCQHETGPEVRHFGHHAHQHATDADAQKPAKPLHDDGKTATDPDCGLCHLSTVQPVLAEFGLCSVLCSPDRPQSRALHCGTRDPDRLERPNWHSA